MASRVAQARRGSGTDIGRQVRAGRTVNMALMSVTLEVSRLSGWLNADADINMKYISVTLEVSRLSGWLNADADCRVTQGGPWRVTCGAGSERAWHGGVMLAQRV